MDTSITSFCAVCRKPIFAEVTDRGMVLRGIEPGTSVAWVSVNVSQECSADSVCKEILLFCSEEHFAQWLGSGDRSRGYRLSPDEAFQLGTALFMHRVI